MGQRNIKSILNDCHLRATPQRVSVYEALQCSGHASADMIFDHIASRGGSRITLASVYNILAQFESKGLCRKRSGLSGKIFYHLESGNHAVLYDSRNDEFKDINDEAIVQAIETCLKGRRFRGYKMDSVDIHLICHPTRRLLFKKK